MTIPRLGFVLNVILQKENEDKPFYRCFSGDVTVVLMWNQHDDGGHSSGWSLCNGSEYKGLRSQGVSWKTCFVLSHLSPFTFHLNCLSIRFWELIYQSINSSFAYWIFVKNEKNVNVSPLARQCSGLTKGNEREVTFSVVCSVCTTS